MKSYIPAPSAEPVGIVIARGDRAEPTPRWTAWIYGPAPMELDEATEQPRAA
jgi:hypothetical protein